MGTGDLPAVIDYILERTNQPKLAYIGHSQGTTQMFYALSNNKAFFRDKVSIFVALAPVTKITNQKADMVSIAADLYVAIDDAAELIHLYEIGGANWFKNTLIRKLCTTIESFCLAIQKIISTDNPDTDDLTRFAVYMGHQPNGTPSRTIMHYAQNMREDRFQEFSPNYYTWFGVVKQHETELIPLSNIKNVPIAMFVGKSDLLANPKDA